MINIFGFLGEKCIRLKVLSILSQSEQIYQGLELSQLYRNLYGEMSFWPQWRHHYLARKLKKFAKTSKKQLLRCGFFVRLHFSSTFTMFIIENDDSSPLTKNHTIFGWLRKNHPRDDFKILYDNGRVIFP